MLWKNIFFYKEIWYNILIKTVFFYKRNELKLHIFRLSGHDFVHYRKIEIGANDRAVYQQSISCFIVYTNFDWFLINLLFSFYHTAPVFSILIRWGQSVFIWLPSSLLKTLSFHIEFCKLKFVFACISSSNWNLLDFIVSLSKL